MNTSRAPRTPRPRTYAITLGIPGKGTVTLLVKANTEPQAAKWVNENARSIEPATEQQIWEAGARGEEIIDGTGTAEPEDGAPDTDIFGDELPPVAGLSQQHGAE